VVGLDAAIDLQVDGLAARVAPAVDAGAGLGQFAQGVRDEGLAAKARVDRHQQDQIQAFHDMVQPFQRCGGVEHQPGAAAVVADQRQGAIDVAGCLGVKADDVRAGLGKGRYQGIHRFDHQVYVDGGGGVGAQGGAHHGSHGQVGDVVVVHDVEVDPVGTGRDHVGDFFAQ